MASDRKPYHKYCVRCVGCHVGLSPRTLNEHDNKLFCDTCYGRYFSPNEFTTDYYTGIVTPEDIERYTYIDFFIIFDNCTFEIISYVQMHMSTNYSILIDKKKKNDWRKKRWREP